MNTEEALAVIGELWSAERCVESYYYQAASYGNALAHIFTLEWTDEYDGRHHADFTTYHWQFYGDTFEEAVVAAAQWCQALAPWKPCGECNGQGVWKDAPCSDCHGTGLEAQA